MRRPGAGELVRGGRVMTATCEGCEGAYADVRQYRARFRGAAWETVRYCDECAGLARANWSGDVDDFTLYFYRDTRAEARSLVDAGRYHEAARLAAMERGRATTGADD
uniref:Uncharacterized protein n=1 Tax=viral metagenome TaxID=1070528 RepID=A0A6H2A331_9ZZZZ